MTMNNRSADKDYEILRNNQPQSPEADDQSERDSWIYDGSFLSLGPFPLVNLNRPPPSATQNPPPENLEMSNPVLNLNISPPSPPPNPPPANFLSTPLTTPSDSSVNSRSRSRSPPQASLHQPPPPPTAVIQRRRRVPSRLISEGKSENIEPPFPWATNRRATVHTLSHILSQGITSISDNMQCKKCDYIFTIKYDLVTQFRELSDYITHNKNSLRHRAPAKWENPTLPPCIFCKNINAARPMISQKKRNINWLFLFLGELLGCCTLDQLKYFCKHTNNHRTGAKNRVLFLAYLAMCNQLEPGTKFELGFL